MVYHGVAVDLVQGISFGNVFTTLADDQWQLCLIVQLAGDL